MFEELFDSYKVHLNRQPVSEHTRRNYVLRVRTFLEWLAGSPEGEEALRHPVERDYAVRDFKVWMLTSGKSPNTVNSHFAALDNFFLFLGLDRSKVRRQDLPAASPKALEADELRRLNKVIAKADSLRNRILALLMLNTGLRISEVAGLDKGDVLATARRGQVIVRCGKGSKHRVVPMNSELREAMLTYLPTVPEGPLFSSQKGGRLSIKAIDHVMRALAADAGVEMSAHTLRHTCFTRLVRAGVDLVAVAEIAGHSRLETTRRYCLPSEEAKAKAMEVLCEPA